MWLATATFVTAIGGVIGTISTIILAWRADSRTAKESELKAKESELKLVQLQQQIKEMELKLNASADSKPKIFLGE